MSGRPRTGRPPNWAACCCASVLPAMSGSAWRRCSLFLWPTCWCSPGPTTAMCSQLPLFPTRWWRCSATCSSAKSSRHCVGSAWSSSVLASSSSAKRIRAPHRSKSDVREALLFLIIIVAGTGGELCVTRAMKDIGEVHDFRPPALLRFMRRAFLVGWMWIGIAMMTVAFFALLAALSFENVSFVVPVTALSYGAGAVGAMLFLRERISLQRWVGVLIVCAGVTIVLLTKH